MKSWKKMAIAGTTVAAAALALAGCSSNSSTSSSSSTTKLSGSIKLYVDTQQQPTFKTVVAGFTKANPGVKVDVVANASGSANAKTDIAKDPSKYADVFAVPNDQLGDMADKGYINQIAPKYASIVKSDDSSVAYQGEEYKGKLYAVPNQMQAQTLFYNKSKLTADDVKSWDTLTSKGVVATDFTNAYNFYPVFFSAGTTLYGTSGEDLTDKSVSSDKGVAAMQWFADQKSNKGVMQTSNALNQLQSGAASAVLDGPWDTANIQKILGDNFAVAPYPTITVGGKTVQMQAFLGIEGFAVNSKSKNQAAAQALASYLGNESAQLALAKSQGTVPVNTKALSTSEVKDNAETMAVLKMSQKGYSTLQPKVSEMATFWTDAAPLINGAYTGQIPSSDFASKLATFASAITKN